jgi:hypothetical protein
MLGQVYLVMLFLLLFGWHTLTQNKFIYAGVSWGMLAAFKFLPLFFIPFLLYKKHYKIITIFIISFITIHLFTFITGGKSVYITFFEIFNANYLHGKVANEMPISVQYQSIEVIGNILIKQYGWPLFVGTILKLSWKLLWISIFIGIFMKYYKSKHFLLISTTSVILLLLLFENGSASYHLLFGLFPLLAYLKFSTNTNWKMILLCSYATMGFIPVLVNNLPFDNFILSFSRLWCLSLFAACFFIALKKEPTFIK